MDNMSTIKKKMFIFLIVLFMLRFGFNYLGNSQNSNNTGDNQTVNNSEDTQTLNNLSNKIITMQFQENSYIIKLEELCSIDMENNKIVINEDVLKNKISEISQYVNRVPVDAKIIDEKTFSIQKESEGYTVDEVQLMESIYNYINSNNLKDSYNIQIPVIVEIPEMTEAILNKIKNTEISAFSTKYNPSQKGRTENLRISTEILNGTIIYPGQVFSMDNKLGERTVEKGYKYAPIFSGGKVISGLAGGICQTTTTTYNAALLANLQIVERYRHGLKVTYIGKGRDAAISRNAIDLKFKNNTEYPIYIKAGIDNKKGLLTVKIYGYKKDFSINIVTACQLKNKRQYYFTYRQIYDSNNVLVKKELVSTDIY